MKLIIFPLIFLIVFAMLNMLGIGTTYSVTNVSDSPMMGDGWWDANGHYVAYDNLTAAGEAGQLVFRTSGQVTVPFWKNATGEYIVYNTDTADYRPDLDVQFDAFGTLGLIAILAGAVIIAAVAGQRLVGTGEVGTSGVFHGAVYGLIWATFSALSFGLIGQIPFFGVPFYFFLTILYTLGVSNRIGGGGGTE